MADSEKEACMNFAWKHSGEFFNFNNDGKVMVGKVAGYYPALALLVMEVPTEPNNPIDPIQPFWEGNGCRLTKGSYYCYCTMRGIQTDKTDPSNKSRFPHKCPRCQKPAYVGVVPNSVDCSSMGCVSYKK
jgi:hypothetical protein